MAFLHRPTATLTYTLVDETGSRATVAFDVPYATLAAAAIAAAARNAGEGADTATLIRQGLKELAK